MSNTKNVGGGEFEYSAPVINTIDIVVEKGFATSGQLEDAGYDNAWTDED